MAPAKKAAKKSTAKRATKKSTAKRATKKSTAKRATKKATGKRAKKSTRKATSRRSSGASTASVVVASKLRETIRGHDARMAADLVDAVNAEVHDLLTKAVKRAQDNGRSTVRPSDL